MANGVVVKGKKGRKKGKLALTSSPTSDNEDAAKINASAKESWGVLEPLRALLEPLTGTVRPLLTGNMVYGLLVGLLVATWFGFGANRQGARPSPDHDLLPRAGYVNRAQRLAAYDEMWRREESELWEWIEERVGLDRLGRDATGDALAHKRTTAARQRSAEERLREEKADQRDVREAIRVTEEKLDALKAVVDRKDGVRGL